MNTPDDGRRRLDLTVMNSGVTMLTTQDVALLLKTSRRTVRLMAKTGALRGLRLARPGVRHSQWRFTIQAVEEYVGKREGRNGVGGDSVEDAARARGRRLVLKSRLETERTHESAEGVCPL